MYTILKYVNYMSRLIYIIMQGTYYIYLCMCDPNYKSYILAESRNSSVSIATGCGLDDRGSYPGGGWEFLSSTPRPDRLMEPTQPPIQWVPGALSLGVNRPGREADHSTPFSAEVKKMHGAIRLLPQYVFMARCLVKHRDFTVTLCIFNTE
jgi:hypothetical protein